jgi:cytidine deaminase
MDADRAADLMDAARAVLRPRRIGGRLFADVASALMTDGGERFVGVCLDTGSGTGFCAEHSAIAAMVTAGHHRIGAIIAVWRDEQGRLYVLPPCGRCREFMRQVHPGNLDTVVLLAHGRQALLRDLLPAHDWPRPEPASDD